MTGDSEKRGFPKRVSISFERPPSEERLRRQAAAAAAAREAAEGSAAPSSPSPAPGAERADAVTLADVEDAVASALTRQNLDAIASALVDAAKAGDSRAAKLVFKLVRRRDRRGD